MKKPPALDYELLLDQALRQAVLQAIKHVAEYGFDDQHHFYISFNTRAKGVEIADWLLDRYPTEMTIVLQYQFNDLTVTNDGFSVKLSFNNMPQKLVIPAVAITSFSDPAASFNLQFDVENNLTEPSGDGLMPILMNQAKSNADFADSAVPEGANLVAFGNYKAKQPRVPKSNGGNAMLSDSPNGISFSKTKTTSGNSTQPTGASDSQPENESGAKVLSFEQFRRKPT